MSNRKRFLLLGSLSILLLAGLLVTFHPKAPIAHAACSQGCPINSCPPGQSENNSGNNTSWVEVIQFTLNSIVQNSDDGFAFPNWPLSIDGVYGSKTQTAVSDYQKANNISNGGGAVGDRTWESFGMCPGSYFLPTHRLNPTGETHCPSSQSENSSSNDPVLVQAIQDMLNMSYNFAPIDLTPDPWTPYLGSDGSFGTDTEHAVVDYQAFVGLTGTGGVVGNRTWSSLGMCW